MNWLRKLTETVKAWIVKDNYAFEIETAKREITAPEIANHPLVRAALTRISQAVASVSLTVFKGDEPISETDPAAFVQNTLLQGFDTHTALRIITHDLFIFGNSFAFIRKVGRKVLGLQRLQPTQMLLNEDGSLTYFPAGQKIARDELVWFKIIDPVNPEGLGLPIIASIAKHIELITSIDAFASEFLENAAFPAAILKVSERLPKEAIERKKHEIQASHGKGLRYNWLILSKESDVQFSDVKLNLGDLPTVRKTLREEVLSLLNVPPAVLGFYEYANYANAREQTKIFWRDTILPLLSLIENTLNADLFLKHFGQDYWCAFDVSFIPHIRESIADVGSSLVQLVRSGIITINEAREMIGKDEPLSWGDYWWQPAPEYPVSPKDVVSGGQGERENGGGDEKEFFRGDKER